jgi:putative glycosyltransferase (TIGR04348 family)
VRVLIVTPPSQGATGNRVTAERWARILGELGHACAVAHAYEGQGCDLLVALHAVKSGPSIRRHRLERPAAPVVVALTGTDIYGDESGKSDTRDVLAVATRLVVLQPLAAGVLPPEAQAKVRTIRQSVEPLRERPAPHSERFEVSVVANLRPVKDPLRAARAARRLPADSRIHVLHVGGALDPTLAVRARAEESSNPRYTWLGPLEHPEALRVLARSRLLVLSSTIEGGANVISEALVHGIPVLASRIAGSIGLLGADHPGTFEVGDTAALAALLLRAEREPAFLADLRARSARLASLFTPELERESWRALLGEIREL